MVGTASNIYHSGCPDVHCPCSGFLALAKFDMTCAWHARKLETHILAIAKLKFLVVSSSSAPRGSNYSIGKLLINS